MPIDEFPQDSEETERFGYTFGLDPTADIATNDLKQFIEVNGKGAVVQDLKICLLTPKGSDPFRPEYGLDYFRAVGTSDYDLKGAIRDAIGPDADPRVLTIDDISIERESGSRDVDVEITLTLISSDTVSIDFAPVNGR